MLTILQRQLHRTGQLVTIDELTRWLQPWFQVVQNYPAAGAVRRPGLMGPTQVAFYKELHLEACTQ